MSTSAFQISIGIFAHNEEDNILRTLDSLSRQDIFSRQSGLGLSTTVSVIANGCSDNTTSLSKEYFTRENFGDQSCFQGRVIEISEPGKSNAWNSFIHDRANECVDYFICMDSDITFGSVNVISALIAALSNSESAYLAIDVAEKDTKLKKTKTLFEHTSLFFSKIIKKDSTAVAGSLYCARGSRLRNISMPKGLPVEDGFLRAMLVTDLFTKKDNNERILVVDNVCHYFTPDPSIKSLLRHEERLLIGTFINSVIYRFLWDEVSATGKDAGQIIAEKNTNHLNWLEELIADYRVAHSPIIPKHFYYKYWKRWKNLKLPVKIISFPIITVGTVVKYFLLKKIERRLSRESGVGTW